MKYIIGCIVALLVFAGCTDKQRARQFGGETTVSLEKGQKLVNATWKQDNLWLLTRDFKPGEEAQKYRFVEDSSFGMMEGKITIYESK